MSKHQVCPNCHSDFVGPDSNINHNLCRDCDEMIHVDCHKQITELQAENKRLIEAIDVSLYAIKNLGAGGHAETPLLVLKPERGDNAVILATYMPHSGADTTLQYLQRECVRPMEQALKGQTND